MSLAPRAVLVHRRSELDELVDRHGTRGQAEFFLRTRGRALAGRPDRARRARPPPSTRSRPRCRRTGDVATSSVATCDRFAFEPGGRVRRRRARRTGRQRGEVPRRATGRRRRPRAGAEPRRPRPAPRSAARADCSTPWSEVARGWSSGSSLRAEPRRRHEPRGAQRHLRRARRAPVGPLPAAAARRRDRAAVVVGGDRGDRQRCDGVGDVDRRRARVAAADAGPVVGRPRAGSCARRGRRRSPARA